MWTMSRPEEIPTLANTAGAIVPLGWVDAEGVARCPDREPGDGPFLIPAETGADARDGYAAIRLCTTLAGPTYADGRYLILEPLALPQLRRGEHVVIETDDPAEPPFKSRDRERWRSVFVGAYASRTKWEVTLTAVERLPAPPRLQVADIVNVWSVVRQVTASPFC